MTSHMGSKHSANLLNNPRVTTKNPSNHENEEIKTKRQFQWNIKHILQAELDYDRLLLAGHYQSKNSGPTNLTV